MKHLLVLGMDIVLVHKNKSFRDLTYLYTRTHGEPEKNKSQRKNYKIKQNVESKWIERSSQLLFAMLIFGLLSFLPMTESDVFVAHGRAILEHGLCFLFPLLHCNSLSSNTSLLS